MESGRSVDLSAMMATDARNDLGSVRLLLAGAWPNHGNLYARFRASERKHFFAALQIQVQIARHALGSWSSSAF